jgi:LemA protein
MASNFSQKGQLENNNVASNAESSVIAKIFYFGSFIFIIPIFYHISTVNWFRKAKEQAMQQLSNIDTKLTERFNTLENQLSVAKAVLKQEKDIFIDVSKYRSKITGSNNNPEAMMEKNSSMNELGRSFNVVLENYPQLQSTPAMQQLMKTVKDLERDLEANRRFYNSVVTSYNSALAVFPKNVVAESLRLIRMPLFEAEDYKRENYKLDFSEKTAQ